MRLLADHLAENTQAGDFEGGMRMQGLWQLEPRVSLHVCWHLWDSPAQARIGAGLSL